MNDLESIMVNYPDLILRQAQYALANGWWPLRRDRLQLRVWKWLAAEGKGRSRDHELRQVMAIHQDGPEKAELEARLLTPASFDAIANKMNLSPTVVQLYHDVVFAVKPQLKVVYWIQAYALQTDPMHPDPLDEARIWREAGWQCPPALEILIADSRHVTSPSDHALAERIRLYIRFYHTPLFHPDFRRLHRQVRDDAVAQAIASPSAELAQIVQFLDIMALAAREAPPRRTPSPVFRMLFDGTTEILAAKKRRQQARVTQSAQSDATVDVGIDVHD